MEAPKYEFWTTFASKAEMTVSSVSCLGRSKADKKPCRLVTLSCWWKLPVSYVAFRPR